MTDSSFKKPYSRLWNGWYRDKIRAMALVLGLMFVVAVASAGYSKSIQLIIGAFEAVSPSVYLWGPALVIGLAFLKSAAQYASVILSNRLVGQVEAALQKEMFGSLVEADLSRLARVAPAAQAARFSTDIVLVGAATRQMIKGLTAILTIIVTFIVMLTIDWPLTLILIGVFMLALAPVIIIGKRVRQISRETQVEIGAMTSNITEGLGNIRLARTYQLEEPLKAQAANQFDKLFELKLNMVDWKARISPVMEVLAGSAVAVLLGIVGWRMVGGTISLADFMGLLAGLGIASSPARRLGATFATMQQGSAALERIYELFDAQNLIDDPAAPVEMQRASGEIVFEDVSFAYPDGQVALKNINLNIKAGMRVAFVGRSGAGKSTIFNLLPRLYDATSGSIKLDGVLLSAMRLNDLRRQIAVVSQESVLLSGTVAENIGYGRVDHTRDDVISAAESAAADGFITALPDGYETRILPSEASFSGGEKQRLSIARAILRDAPILMLDEPTAALDAESESLIREALDRLAAGRTTLIIAHRLSTILDADMIVVMDDGQVVDRGTHAELLAREGLYADLYNLQFSG